MCHPAQDRAALLPNLQLYFYRFPFSLTEDDDACDGHERFGNRYRYVYACWTCFEHFSQWHRLTESGKARSQRN